MEIVVRGGETRILPSRVLSLTALVIQAGGTLEIEPGASGWAVFSISEKCEISGELVFRNFSARRQEFLTQTPKGYSISHKFFMDNIGGDGGPGSNRAPAAMGGLGAFGDVDYGGGGGGGAIYSRGSGRGYPGQDGVRWRGGRGLHPSNYGGNGGQRGRFSNGGLLCIETDGLITGDGVIDLRAQPGQPGITKSGHAAGGSGAGGPGGEGGVALLFSKSANEALRFLLDGGVGGTGGDGNNPGTSGEDGGPGFRNWL